MFRNNKDGSTEKHLLFFVCHCLGAWEPGTGVARRGNTRVGRTHETTDTWALCGGVNAVQRRKPDVVRCSAPSWTSEVRMPEQEACPSVQVRGHRRALECRLRHRPILLPRPYRQALLSRLWRDVPDEEFIAGAECRGLRHGLAEFVVAVGAQATQTSYPRLAFVVEVRDCASLPFEVVAVPCS